MKTVYLDHPDNGGGGVSGGSDAGPVGGNNGVADGGGNSDASHLHCSGSASATAFNVTQQKPNIIFALDRSRSMLTALGNNNLSRFGVTSKAINDIVSPTSPSGYGALVPFGYVEFPTGDSSCSNVCCAAGFPSNTGLSSNFSMWLGSCVSSQSLTCNANSDSAPTYQALNKIVTYFKRNSSDTLYALLLTDGIPSADCAFDPSGGSACDQTINLINDMSSGNLGTNPITTIVMAIGAVELDSPPAMPTVNHCLNQMAFQGGHPASSTTAYTLASTEPSVHAQIDSIVSNAICQFDIDSSFDPNGKFEIDYNGSPMTVPDATNGWTVDKTKLTFNGSLCDTLITAMRSSTHHNVAVRECVDPSHPFQPPAP